MFIIIDLELASQLQMFMPKGTTVADEGDLFKELELVSLLAIL